MLEVMPLVWCGVLIVLFAAHLAAGFRLAAAFAAAASALAASIAGLQPWQQVLVLALIWIALRLGMITFVGFVQKEQPDIK